MLLPKEDLAKLQKTVPDYDRKSLILSLDKTIDLYCELRTLLFPDSMNLQIRTKKKSLEFLNKIKNDY